MKDDDPGTHDDDDGGGEDPITPEVVGRPRMGRAPRTPRAAGGRKPLGGFRIAAIALATVGALLGLQAGKLAADPAGSRCSIARNSLVNDIGDLEDEPNADVSEALGDLETEDDVNDDGFPCEQAIATADAVGAVQGDPPLSSQSVIQRIGILAVVTGLLELVGGFLSMRRPTRTSRRIAGVGTVLGGLVWGILGFGLFAMLFHALIGYGLFFSKGAREIFGDPRGLGLGRRAQPSGDS